MSKVEELNKLALKLTGSNPYKKTIKESLESIATYLAGENIEVENIEDAIQKCTEYYSGGGGGNEVIIPNGIKFANSTFTAQPEWFSTADWSEVTTFESIFQSCKQVTEINIDAIEALTNATNTSYMFNGCTNLVTINLGNLDNLDRGESVIWLYTSMFNNCSSLDDDTLNMILKLLPKLQPRSNK